MNLGVGNCLSGLDQWSINRRVAPVRTSFRSTASSVTSSHVASAEDPLANDDHDQIVLFVGDLGRADGPPSGVSLPAMPMSSTIGSGIRHGGGSGRDGELRFKWASPCVCWGAQSKPERISLCRPRRGRVGKPLAQTPRLRLVSRRRRPGADGASSRAACQRARAAGGRAKSFQLRFRADQTEGDAR